MILSDRDIRLLKARGELEVEPFAPYLVRENGLDLRLGSEYCRLVTIDAVVDSRRPEVRPSNIYECGRASEEEGIIVYPGEHILLHTMERIRLPPYVAGLVNLRSTYARLGLFIPSTVADAGFEGQLTIEVVGSAFPVRLHPGDRFIHLVLVTLTSPAEKPYNGSYQGQRGVRLPKIFDLIKK